MKDLEGYLEKLGEKGLGKNRYKRRWFSLKDGEHVNYYEKHDLKKLCGCIEVAAITDVVVIEDTGAAKKRTSRLLSRNKPEPTYFHIVTEKRTFQLAAESEKDAIMWVAGLGDILRQRREKEEEAEAKQGSAAAGRSRNASARDDWAEETAKASSTADDLHDAAARLSEGAHSHHDSSDPLPVAEETTDAAAPGSVQSPPAEQIIVGDPAFDIRSVSPGQLEPADEGGADSTSPRVEDSQTSSGGDSHIHDTSISLPGVGGPQQSVGDQEETSDAVELHAGHGDGTTRSISPRPMTRTAAVSDLKSVLQVSPSGEDTLESTQEEEPSTPVPTIGVPRDSDLEKDTGELVAPEEEDSTASAHTMTLSVKGKDFQRSHASSNLKPQVDSLLAAHEIAKNMTGETMEGEEAAEFGRLRESERQLRHHNTELQRTTNLLKKELVDAKEENVKLQVRVAAVEERSKHVIDELEKELRAEISKLQSDAAAVITERDEARRSASLVEEKLQRAVERHEQERSSQQALYEELNKSVEADGSKALADVASLKQRNLELEQALAHHKEESTATIRAAETAAAELKKELEEVSADAQGLRAAVEGAQRASAEAQIASKADQEKAGAQLKDAISEKEATAARVQELEIEARDLREENERQAASVSRLTEGQEKAAVEEISRLNEEVKEANAARQQAEKSLAASERKHTELKALVQTSSVEVAAATQAAAAAEMEASKAREALAAVQEEGAKCGEEAAKARAEFEQRISELNGEIHARDQLVSFLQSSTATEPHGEYSDDSADEDADEAARSAPPLGDSVVRAAEASTTAETEKVHAKMEELEGQVEEEQAKHAQLAGQVKKLKFELASKAKQVAKLQKVNQELSASQDEVQHEGPREVAAHQPADVEGLREELSQLKAERDEIVRRVCGESAQPGEAASKGLLLDQIGRQGLELKKKDQLIAQLRSSAGGEQTVGQQAPQSGEDTSEARVMELLDLVESLDRQVANTTASVHLLNQQMMQTQKELVGTRQKLQITEEELNAKDRAIIGLNEDLKRARLATMTNERATPAEAGAGLVTELRNELEKTRISSQQLAKKVTRHQHEVCTQVLRGTPSQC